MIDVVKQQPVPLAVNADGVIRVGCTRVTLDTVVGAFRAGASAEGIVDQYPSLLLADVYSVIGFYLRNQTEIDSYLADRHRVADETQARIEATQNTIGIRERLIARQRQRAQGA